MSAYHLPNANQAQISHNDTHIVRANQRDLYHVAALREQLETLLRSTFGTRWLLRWEKEVSLFSKMGYYGLTTAYAFQTLGEEYTDIWQLSHRTKLSSRKTLLVLASLSAVPQYLLRYLLPMVNGHSRLTKFARHLPLALDILTEANLAVFYFFGTYYDLLKRLLRIRYVTTLPPNPNVTLPSYSILGLMLAIRLAYRLVTYIRSLKSVDALPAGLKHDKQVAPAVSTSEPSIDARTVSSILTLTSVEESETLAAEDDENTVLNIISLSTEERSGRRCTLCLEERTSTCATECGHLFCWNCISGWGREKSECPLCRQSLSLTRLLPIHNL
ncbi:Pex12 amino terminal region-domain-containing protein [Hysterangium stoloniferum]|nr:Pex12 amino terminal region-domain-containing protein [Hysterangium stoloniferum]